MFISHKRSPKFALDFKLRTSIIFIVKLYDKIKLKSNVERI
nr:MAG TPA: hypothetical protein [Caudoviricetes sp.]